MPYASNADLNPAVRKAHQTPHGQTTFRKAFNAAEATGKYDEADLFKIAHSAADKVTKRKRAPSPREQLRRYVNAKGF